MAERAVLAPLEMYADCGRSFSLQDALDAQPVPIKREHVRALLRSSAGIIALDSPSSNEQYFVFARTLFQSYLRLNARLASLRRFTLTHRQFASLVTGLRPEGRWITVPGSALRFGRRLGLVSERRFHGDVIFPVAFVMSFMPARAREAAVMSLLCCAPTVTSPAAFRHRSHAVLNAAWRQFTPRVVRVVRAREGLAGAGRRHTHEEIGCQLALTRERIRQIEQSFWTRLTQPANQAGALFVEAFLCKLFAQSGRLIAEGGSMLARWFRFLGACANVPGCHLKAANLCVVGVPAADWMRRPADGSLATWADEQAIFDTLSSNPSLGLSEDDAKTIAARLAAARQRRLKLTDRVYIALRHIGRPAHYSQVTETHNNLFPKHAASEPSIHAALGRQEGGVVWVGIRGTFALRELGYERPSKTLYQTVADIVRTVYQATGRPVPWHVILAEIGRHRHVVKRTSVILATWRNPRVAQCGKGLFVPAAPASGTPDSMNSERLHEILAEFQREN